MSTVDERIAKIKEQKEVLKKKKAQLDAKEKALLSKQNEKKRKARTKRLIEIGAIVEKVFGEEVTEEMKPRFEDFLKKQDERGMYFTKALKGQS